ncbi:MAG: hypothetical protein BWK80_32680 [Desulfobacteraceae bacterium IS3]|nr:MAG: hypothetical protein BWK80_32680 [Desulfobacteraceae bacterium IS3]
MLSQISDTYPKAEKIQIALLRRAGIAERFSKIRSLSRTVIQLSRRAISRANPGLSKEESNLLFIRHHYGRDIADCIHNYLRKEINMKDSDILAAIKPVTAAFEKLGISYYIGGSVASSAYGTARATLDVDIVSDLKILHVHSLVKLLESAYYIDEDMILDAIRRCFSFNLIHLETMLKVDVFILKDSSYNNEAFQRRRKDTLDEDENAAEFYLVSPEDIILNKLEWYRLGGGVSERQWNDVLGVIKVQENSLDRHYLRHWASDLKISQLLEQAFCDAGVKF